jgi:alpha-L-fucosidase
MRKLSDIFRWVLVATSLALLGSAHIRAQETSLVDASELAPRVKEWRDLKFGLMMHWGLYSVAGGVWKGKNIEGYNEQIMHRAKIPWSEYLTLTNGFTAEKFDPDFIARLAKEAGMRHVIITSKHHEGFNMWHTRLSDFNTVDSTPFGKDAIKLLADACARQGMKFGLYYSLIDWHYPGAAPMSDHNSDVITPALEEYTVGQLRELLTGYGPLCEIWFDMSKPTLQQSQRFANLVRALQPNCMVSGRIFNGQEDFLVCGDNEVPTHWFAGAWESPVTVYHDTWGYRSWQKRDDLAGKIRGKIRDVAFVTARGGNYLLNIGPRPDGTIEPFEVDMLRGIGKWMRTHGEAIFGAEPETDLTLMFGYATARPGRLYLFVRDVPPDNVLKIPNWQAALPRACSLGEFSAGLECAQAGSELTIKLPAEKVDPNLTVVAVDYAGPKPFLPTNVRRLAPGETVSLGVTNSLPWHRIAGQDYYSQHQYVIARQWNVLPPATGKWTLTVNRAAGGPPACYVVLAGDLSVPVVFSAGAESQDCGRITLTGGQVSRIVLRSVTRNQALDDKIADIQLIP